MVVYVCIGNGVRADGTASTPSRAVVQRVFEAIAPASPKDFFIIFSGGFRGGSRKTEAQAMWDYACSFGFTNISNFFVEDLSYRTHWNAIEALKAIVRWGIKDATIVVCDHPLHLPRTLLALRVVNRLRHRGRGFTISGLASEEVYDTEVPGQPQWRTREAFAAHERKGMLLYRVLLFSPWARLGLWLLCKLWPMKKQ